MCQKPRITARMLLHSGSVRRKFTIRESQCRSGDQAQAGRPARRHLRLAGQEGWRARRRLGARYVARVTSEGTGGPQKR